MSVGLNYNIYFILRYKFFLDKYFLFNLTTCVLCFVVNNKILDNIIFLRTKS